MFQRSTIVYVVLLLALVGAYLYLKNREQPAETEPTAEPAAETSYLFDAADGTPSSIRVEAETGETVEIARDAANAWTVVLPIEGNADPASAEAAASQVTTMRVMDEVPGVDLKIVGLDVPQYVLTIKFTSGAQHVVDVGNLAPSGSGYYVSDGDGEVLIVSRDALDMVIGLLQFPPYLETPTSLPATPDVGTAPDATATP